MKKKIYVLMLVAIMSVAFLAGCNDTATEVTSDAIEKEAESTDGLAENSEEVSEEDDSDFESSDSTISALELEYDSLMGTIEQMNCYLGTDVLLLSDDKLYYQGKEYLNPENGVKEFWAYSCMETGQMIAVIDMEGKLSLWECGSMVYADIAPELVFEGLLFDTSREFILDASGKTVEILRLEGGGSASITYYSINDDKTLSVLNTIQIEGYEDWSEEMNDYIEIPVKELIALSNPDRLGGYSIFGITDANDLYQITQFGKDCEMDYIVGGIENAYCDYSIIYSTDPIYSFIGDANKLYTKVKGDSMGDSTDDAVLAFVLPEGHTTDEIVKIFGDIDMLCVFEFSNGDIYYVDEAIDEETGGEYAMIKCEELSELNAQGRILEIGMPSTSGNPKVYVLLDDFSVYSMEF